MQHPPVKHNLFNRCCHFAYGDTAMWLQYVRHPKNAMFTQNFAISATPAVIVAQAPVLRRRIKTIVVKYSYCSNVIRKRWRWLCVWTVAAFMRERRAETGYDYDSYVCVWIVMQPTEAMIAKTTAYSGTSSSTVVVKRGMPVWQRWLFGLWKDSNCSTSNPIINFTLLRGLLLAAATSVSFMSPVAGGTYPG